MRILLSGYGKMGSALLTRWNDLQLSTDITVIEPQTPASPPLAHIKHYAELHPEMTADVVVFAVKPQVLGDIVGQYKHASDAGALILSIAAGKPVSFFETALGAAAHIIRAMPNTPAAIGQGITVAYANKNVTPAQKEIAAKLLGAVGDVLWVDDEKLLNPVTALSGSGPAYIFLLIETLTTAGIKIGLAPDMAAKLARQTVIGSAALAADSKDVPAATLRENVTSPGGTTAAALKVLMDDQALQDLFNRALIAATKRAEELAK